MTIAKKFASKLAVASVALAMVFMAAAPAKAQTTEALQQMINELLQQVAALQSQTGQEMSDSSVASVCPYTWTRSLSQGSTGDDVMKLQQFLNADADTRVSAAGVGSVGMETDYYGPATAAAVSKLQVKYRSDILSPANLVNPTGYFGPGTRTKANGLCVAAPVVVVEVEVEDEDVEDVDEDVEVEDEDEDFELSGEGEIITFEIDDEEDEITEGDEDVAVMRLTLEAEDGDVELSRLDFTILPDTGTANQEDEPWDVFEEFSLWVDGDKVASFEADDEDDYLDDDAGEYEFRFSNINLILEGDSEVEVVVAVTVARSVDGSDTANEADWNIEPTEVRYFDADGVATTDDSVDEMTTGGDESEHFDIEEEGADDDADLEANSDTPDPDTLLVDEDTADSSRHIVHIFDIEVDNDSGDLEVGDVFAQVTITNANPAAAIAGGQEDVIADIYMTIDGVTEKGEANTSGADNEGDAIALNGGATTVEYLFEFDQNVVLEADSDYEVEIAIEFEGQDSNYVNGVTVQTIVDGQDGGVAGNWEVEGSEDDNILTGNDTSELMTLATVVPDLTGIEITTDRNEAGDAGTISVEFTMAADGDADITFTFADITNVDGAVDDLRFTLSGTDTTIAASAITKVAGDATYGANVWTIAEGDDATFVLDVTFTTVDAADDGTYRVTVDTIEGVEVDETSEGMSLTF